jgi:hypothetical protein
MVAHSVRNLFSFFRNVKSCRFPLPQAHVIVRRVKRGLQSRDKGDAVLDLVQRSESDCVFFVGDGVNDEAVFTRALPHWLTVRVGIDPDSRAQFFLEGQ